MYISDLRILLLLSICIFPYNCFSSYCWLDTYRYISIDYVVNRHFGLMGIQLREGRKMLRKFKHENIQTAYYWLDTYRYISTDYVANNHFGVVDIQLRDDLKVLRKCTYEKIQTTTTYGSVISLAFIEPLNIMKGPNQPHVTLTETR